MIKRSDAAVWAGVESRLSGVEGFIPDAPPWRPSSAAAWSGKIRLGPAVRPFADRGPRRSPLVLVVAAIALLLILIAGAVLVGTFLPDRFRGDEPFGPFGALRQGDGTATAGPGLDGSITKAMRAGTFGVVCSANTSPTGDILTVFLVGPLEVTLP